MTALLGTYKAPLYAGESGPRVGTLRVPLDADTTGDTLRVEPLTPDVVLHADGHDDCPRTVTIDVHTAERVHVATLVCCDTCRP